MRVLNLAFDSIKPAWQAWKDEGDKGILAQEHERDTRRHTARTLPHPNSTIFAFKHLPRRLDSVIYLKWKVKWWVYQTVESNPFLFSCLGFCFCFVGVPEQTKRMTRKRRQFLWQWLPVSLNCHDDIFVFVVLMLNYAFQSFFKTINIV